MPQVVIENPILNSPFDEPRRHFKFDAEGITNEMVEARRVSSYFMPIAVPRKKGRQLEIAGRWPDECVVLKDGTFPRLLLLTRKAHEAADVLHRTIVASTPAEKHLRPVLRPDEAQGSTRTVDFDTTRPVYLTRADKCHVTHVVADTESWEQKTAQALEDMDEVVAYVKNYNLGFVIPYTLDGEERGYYPDFIVRLRDGHEDLLNLIVEVSGERKKDKLAKVATARTLWVPAINAHGGFGRWAFIEITDPWDAQNTIRGTLEAAAGTTH